MILVNSAMAALSGQPPSGGGGQHWVCLGGEDTNPSSPLQRSSCAFLSPDEPAREATARADGRTPPWLESVERFQTGRGSSAGCA